MVFSFRAEGFRAKAKGQKLTQCGLEIGTLSVLRHKHRHGRITMLRKDLTAYATGRSKSHFPFAPCHGYCLKATLAIAYCFEKGTSFSTDGASKGGVFYITARVNAAVLGKKCRPYVKARIGRVGVSPSLYRHLYKFSIH